MDQVKIALQYITPKHAISRLVGKLAAAKLGSFTHAIIRWFAKSYDVNLAEAERTQAHQYESFNDFFTRALKPGARSFDPRQECLAHPVDGAVSQFGKIDDDSIFQAKGQTFSATELLGGDETIGNQFNDGSFANIYLSPKDYHRIHMPMDAKLTKMVYVPGDLFSVNPLTARNVPRLFARNERVVCLFETAVGPMAMVLVGATIVASIETVWAGTVTPPAGKQVFTWDYSDKDINFNKGDEMGRFKLGSTVVMLFAEDAVKAFDDSVAPAATTVMGTPLATLNIQ
ncbi:archaetidylserine decarboxylase [Paraferrimonas sp. SM1919]|uniref:archaetidylserine decarboxylase n=1 Tax=Paraferrimonas sp. SM1919 TaxID=2662263 RepID=UPI0013D71048|nr:archaetidylserine decarboxylase [Paraferrimonas sp. SM1919]